MAVAGVLLVQPALEVAHLEVSLLSETKQLAALLVQAEELLEQVPLLPSVPQMELLLRSLLLRALLLRELLLRVPLLMLMLAVVLLRAQLAAELYLALKQDLQAPVAMPALELQQTVVLAAGQQQVPTL